MKNGLVCAFDSDKIKFADWIWFFSSPQRGVTFGLNPCMSVCEQRETATGERDFIIQQKGEKKKETRTETFRHLD